MIQQQEAALLAAFGSLCHQTRALILDYVQYEAEQEKAAEHNHLRLVANKPGKQ